MKVLFYGTPEFAVPTLQHLLDSNHEVVAVVTQPDKPFGRGRKLKAPPIKELAEQHNIPVLQPTSVKKGDFLEAIKPFAPDVAVVVAYGKILPRAVLDLPRHGCINIHASLLPKYRGAAPIQWAVVNGEETTGVTIMQMEEGLDSGPIIAREEVPILEDDDANSVANMLSMVGAAKIVDVLDQLEAGGSLSMEPQDHEAATLAPLIKRDMARIDWTKSAEEIIWLIRGFLLWPKAFTTLKDSEIKIVGADACAPDWVPASAFTDDIEPGTVVEVLKRRGFVVKTGGDHGVVLITRVQPPGKPEMGAFDYVNGGGIDVGNIFK